MKPFIFIAIMWVIIMIVMALGATSPKCDAATPAITYVITSTQNDAPTLVSYNHGGNDMYDSLNWGNGDNDTLPWSLTVQNVGSTPRVMAQYYGSTYPAPTYTCAIKQGDTLLITTTSVGYADCMVRQL